MSHWLIRIPLAIFFLQQGINKLPISVDDAASFDLPLLVWSFVIAGEIGAGVGLLVGGLFPKKFLWELGDLVTRFESYYNL